MKEADKPEDKLKKIPDDFAPGLPIRGSLYDSFLEWKVKMDKVDSFDYTRMLDYLVFMEQTRLFLILTLDKYHSKLKPESTAGEDFYLMIMGATQIKMYSDIMEKELKEMVNVSIGYQKHVRDLQLKLETNMLNWNAEKKQMQEKIDKLIKGL